jgi:hypothetical protein
LTIAPLRALALRERHPLAAAVLVAVLVLTWFCYQGGLSGPLLLDDEPQLRPLIRLLDAGNWQRLLPHFLFSSTGPGGRPVAMASLIASTVAHGGEVVWLKRENLLLHLLTGVVLLVWLLALQRAADRDDARPAPWLPLTAAALWLLHPLQVSTVLYTVQRMTLLCTLFVLAGLAAYAHGRLRQAARMRAGGGPGGAGLIALAFLVMLPLAALSKENGVLFLPLCALQELLLLRGMGTPRQRRLVRGLFGLTLALPLLLAVTVLAPAIWADLVRGAAQRGFTPIERALTEMRVLMLYLGQWLWPSAGQLSFFHDDIQLSLGWLSPPSTLLAALALLLACVLAWRERRRRPLVTLGWFGFLVAHSLEGSVVPLELAFEHRNYLPGAFLAVLVMGLPWHSWAMRWIPATQIRTVLVMAALAPPLALAVQTTQRCFVWGQASLLYPALFAANPASPRLSALFADSYANAGQFDAARAALANQDTVGARLQRADIDCLARAPFDAARLDTLLAGLAGPMAGYEVQGLTHLANDALDQNCALPLPWGLALIERALTLPINQASSRQLLLLYRAHLHYALKNFDAAHADLVASYREDPANPMPLLLASDWWIAEGKPRPAEDNWRLAHQLRGPRAAEAAELIAEMGRRQGWSFP